MMRWFSVERVSSGSYTFGACLCVKRGVSSGKSEVFVLLAVGSKLLMIGPHEPFDD